MFFQIQTDEGINLYGEEMIKVCTLLKPKIPGKVKVVMFLWKFGSKASSITTISHLSLMFGYDFDNPISNNLQKFCLTFLEPSLTISGNVSSSSEQSESQRLGITGGAHQPRFITIKLNFCNTELSYSVHTDLI